MSRSIIDSSSILRSILKKSYSIRYYEYLIRYSGYFRYLLGCNCERWHRSAPKFFDKFSVSIRELNFVSERNSEWAIPRFVSLSKEHRLSISPILQLEIFFNLRCFLTWDIFQLEIFFNLKFAYLCRCLIWPYYCASQRGIFQPE